MMPLRTTRRMEKVRQDKLREVKAGHDGTWVAHPGLVPIAKEIFDEYMKTPNQIHVKRDDVKVTAADLLNVPEGRDHRPGLAIERRRRHPVSGIVAARLGLRADLQPDGRRRHCGDFPHPGVAMDAPRRASYRTARSFPAPMIRDTIKTQLAHIRVERGR